MTEPKLKPYLGPEFKETTVKQGNAFKNYNHLLDTVDPEKIKTALSLKALELSYKPEEGIDRHIIDIAKEVLTETENGAQIGFGDNIQKADEAWADIFRSPVHKDASRAFNTYRYKPDADPDKLNNLRIQLGYSTLAAVAAIHASANKEMIGGADEKHASAA